MQDSGKKKATIFILVYNNSDELGATVESVMEQKNIDAEIILSDDGSSNYDTALLEDYAIRLRERYDTVRVNVNEQNVGTVKHLNRIIQMADGEYLISCSSGDRFRDENTVADIILDFEKQKTLILSTRRMDVSVGGEKKSIRPATLVGILLKFAPQWILHYMLHKKNVLSGCCTFYKKELFEKYGYFDERYHLVEDYPYYVKLLQKKVPFGVSNRVTVLHRMGGVSTGKVHPSIYKDIELMHSLIEKEKEEKKHGN